MKRQLILEDGTVFVGKAFGSETETTGEVVFHTAMTGYQEILSDPTYCGQIVALTYPLIGNYGINRDDFESINLAIHGLIVKEAAKYASNWRSEETLDELLKAKGIPGLEGIDTRKLTRLIRKYGTLRGKLCSLDVNVEEVVNQLKQADQETDQVSRVSTKDAYKIPGKGKRVVLVDFGAKQGMLQQFIELNCEVIVVPYSVTAEEVLRISPDGLMLSNGPGNPENLSETVKMIQGLLGKMPICSIGLGQQLLALASGAKTEKMPFGHHGANHPVKELATGKVDITAQNHSFMINRESLEGTRLEATHVSVNDGTVQGIKHLDYEAFGVQFHPKVTSSPKGFTNVFETFMTMINTVARA